MFANPDVGVGWGNKHSFGGDIPTMHVRVRKNTHKVLNERRLCKVGLVLH